MPVLPQNILWPSNFATIDENLEHLTNAGAASVGERYHRGLTHRYFADGAARYLLNRAAFSDRNWQRNYRDGGT